MNRTWKIGIVVASHLGAAVAGASLGIWYSWRSLQQVSAMMDHMMLTTRYAMHAELQRVEGNAKGYREALLAFLSALEHARNLENPLYGESVDLADKLLTYLRLPRLELKVGNQKESKAYMEQALDTCARLSWRDREPDHLVELSEQLDKKGLLGESKKEGER